MSMELTDEMLGIRKNHEKDSFEWNNLSEHRPDLSPRGIPFEVHCRQGSTKIMGDSECYGCANLYRGVCVMNNQDKIINKAVVPIYSKGIRLLLCDLVTQSLKGLPHIELKGYLLSKYSRGFLNESLDFLSPWLQIPGLLGMLLIDTEWFDGCTATAKKIKGHAFSPSCVKAKTACDACGFRRNQICGLLNSRIFRAGDMITAKEVEIHINELIARQNISQAVGKECRAITEQSPIAGLAKAVQAARDPRRMVNELSLINRLEDLGQGVEENNVMLFNEPAESKEIKQMLFGSEMQVEIKPRPQFETLDYVQALQKSSGIDEFLTMDKT
jgi:hypothetical protein